MTVKIVGSERNVTKEEAEDGEKLPVTRVESVWCLAIVVMKPACVHWNHDFLFSSKTGYYL